jgi:aspartyl/glutamyl-tRNA(Asn/Gln) amidotransferase C subunit
MEVDVEGILPFNRSGDAVARWREDRIQRGIGREKVLSNAPAQREGQIVVPKVVEGA